MTRDAFSYRADPEVPGFPDDRPLIVFDGVCVLCSGSATFVMRRDRAGVFRLSTAQSRLGQALYRHYGLDPASYDTILLIEQGRLFLRSEAALRIAARLGWPWAGAGILRGIPLRLGDAAYDLVARHRYRLFGRHAACVLPQPGQTDRFL